MMDNDMIVIEDKRTTDDDADIPEDVVNLYEHICESKLFILPINKVDGIVCSVVARHHTRTRMPSNEKIHRIEIHVTARYKATFMFGAVVEIDNFTEDDLHNTHRKFYRSLMMLKIIKYSPTINRFFIPKDADGNVSKMDHVLHCRIDGNNTITTLLKCDNIDMDTEECCVCLTPTISTLNCEHHVCLSCESKLVAPTKCPMCRAVYCRFPHDDDSDDDHDGREVY